MSTPCETPIGWESLVAYWADDLDARETDRIDEHLMECEGCAAESARVAGVARAVRAVLPPFVDHAQLDALRARGLRIHENSVQPNERRAIVFGADTDLLIHRLTGLDLTGTASVGVVITVEETGDVLLADPSVPFDRDSGELLIACQRHFASYPPNIVVEVRTSDATGAEKSARYPIPHIFEARPPA